MRARPVVFGILTGLLAMVPALDSRAESPAVEKIVALNKSALTAFAAHDNDKAKDQLMEAVVLGKENGLGMHASMARTYLHLGVVFVDGFKDAEKGQRYFTMAQKVRPDIDLTPSLATPTVKAAFEAARAQSGAKPEPVKAEAKEETKAAKPEPAKPEVKEELKAATPPPEKKETKAEARAREKAEKEEAARQAKADKAAQAEAARQAKADKSAQILEDARTAKFEEKIAAQDSALKKAERESLQREQQLQTEKEKLQKELAQSRASEKQLKADNDRLQAEERKLQAQIAEKDKLLGRKDVELAEAKAEGKREHEGREKAEKADKENAKRIAEAADREKKEREAREKLEKERQLAATKEKERKDKEAQERAAREKLADGPDLPGNIPTPLHCANDVGVVNADLYMHCVPQAQVKAKSLVFYYRTTGNAHFDAATMNRTRKGWFTALIPAGRVTGKSLQYYVEARGQKDEVAVTSGKPTSPNLVVLYATAEAAKKASDSEAVAAATSKASKANARRTPAAKRSKARR